MPLLRTSRIANISGKSCANKSFSQARFATAAGAVAGVQDKGSSSAAYNAWKTYPKWGRVAEVLEKEDLASFEEYWKSDKMSYFEKHWDKSEFSWWRMITQGRLVHYNHFLMLKHDPTFNPEEAIETAIAQVKKLLSSPMKIDKLPSWLLRRSQFEDIAMWVEYKGGQQADPDEFIIDWFKNKVSASSELPGTFWDGTRGKIVIPRVSRFHNECKLFVRIRTDGQDKEGNGAGMLYCMTSPLPKKGEKFNWSPYGWPEFVPYFMMHSYLRKVETPLFPAPDEEADMWN